MNYIETLDYLYNAAPAFEKVGAGAYKEGLTTTHLFDAHFGHPHTKYKTIHVAGTNGKGSTSHTLAAILQKCGYKVGLYTSPHLVDFNERIRVNGIPVSHEYVIDFVERERAFFEPLTPSFFEITTAMAFSYFAEQQVDIAVIEVGLGGRLDCTNIITPLLSVITNISFDHTGFLGNTLEQIAGEKAGIIKPYIPVVIGEYTPETYPVFASKAKECNSDIIFAQDIECGSMPEFQLKGYCQSANARTIFTAVGELQRQGVIPTDEGGNKAIADGFLYVCDITGLRGRWEVIQESPLVVCDTGHNLAGWQYLSGQIMQTAERKRVESSMLNAHSTLRIVFGMVDDKDIDSVLKLLPKDAEYYLTQADTHRAIPVGRLQKIAMSNHLNCKAYLSVKEAYNAAMQESSINDFIFVGGSSYVVADFLA